MKYVFLVSFLSLTPVAQGQTYAPYQDYYGLEPFTYALQKCVDTTRLEIEARNEQALTRVARTGPAALNAARRHQRLKEADDIISESAKQCGNHSRNWTDSCVKITNRSREDCFETMVKVVSQAIPSSLP